MSFHTEDELAALNSFVRHAVRSNAVWVVVGSGAIAHVDTASHPGMAVHLIWSRHSEATRWADLLAAHPLVEGADLATFLTEVLPWLGEPGRIIGVDWSTDPAEPVISASELAPMVRDRILDQFCEDVVAEQAVWLLQSDNGPAVVPASDGTGMILPAWGERTAAERATEGPWSAMRPFRMTLREFNARVLTACAGAKARIAANYIAGAGCHLLQPWALKARLGETAVPERRIA